MIRRPPRSTRTDPLFPYTTLFRSFSQVLAAALVAQPAGDADVPVAVKVVEQLFASAGEAVHDDRAVPAVELAHDGKEVGMRVALVQEQGLGRSRGGEVGGDLQLHLERAPLRRPWREVAEIVQPEFANRRSEEHTSELQSIMRISYAVFCLKK